MRPTILHDRVKSRNCTGSEKKGVSITGRIRRKCRGWKARSSSARDCQNARSPVRDRIYLIRSASLNGSKTPFYEIRPFIRLAFSPDRSDGLSRPQPAARRTANEPEELTAGAVSAASLAFLSRPSFVTRVRNDSLLNVIVTPNRRITSRTTSSSVNKTFKETSSL
jgi:hypothetical protein